MTGSTVARRWEMVRRFGHHRDTIESHARRMAGRAGRRTHRGVIHQGPGERRGRRRPSVTAPTCHQRRRNMAGRFPHRRPAVMTTGRHTRSGRRNRAVVRRCSGE